MDLLHVYNNDSINVHVNKYSNRLLTKPVMHYSLTLVLTSERPTLDFTIHDLVVRH